MFAGQDGNAMKHVIFIEGVSGVGKSTTVNLLAKRLRDLGYSVSSHLEDDADGPLDLCWTAYLTKEEYDSIAIAYPAYADKLAQSIIEQSDYILLQYQIGSTPLFPPELHHELCKREFCYNPVNSIVPLSTFTEVFVARWQKFVHSKEAASVDFAVFDGSLISHMTNDLIRNYNASKDQVLHHLEHLIQAVLSLNPVIYYLASQNVCQQLIHARESRGQAFPTDTQIKFWEQRMRMDLSVLPELSLDAHIADISNKDWQLIISKIITNILMPRKDI